LAISISQHFRNYPDRGHSPALATGIRRGEVFALRWRNVDLDRGFLRVMESLEQTKTGIRFKAPKKDRTRTVSCRRSRSPSCANSSASKRKNY